MDLRDYQRECLIRSRSFVRNGSKRGLISLPTGTGKTVIFAHFPKLFTAGKTLVLAHREELLDQAASVIRSINPALRVEIERASRHTTSRADVVVASVQTFARSPERMHNWRPRDFSTIVIDEAHHSTAASYLRILEYFGLAPNTNDLGTIADLDVKVLTSSVKERFSLFTPNEGAPTLFGFTATPERADKRGLEWIFDELVYSRTILQMMEAGWLCKIRGQRVSTKSDITEVKTVAGEFATRQLSEAVNTPARNALAVSSYLELAKGRQALAFAVDVKHARDLHQAFVSAGVRAGIVVGTTIAGLRHEAVDQYHRGELNVLVNCMVLTEGFDDPNTSCLVMARPTKSQLLYTQMLGRGTRIAEGKADLLVIDLVDAAKVGTPSLNTMFGLPPKISLEGAATDVLTVRKAMDELETQVPMSSLGDVTTIQQVKDLASAFDPLMRNKPESYLRTTLAWVKTSFGYALSLGNYSQLGVVMSHLDSAELRVKSPEGRVESLGWYKSAQSAITEGETWVREHHEDRIGLLSNSSKWRQDIPTGAQLDMCRRLGLKVPLGSSKGDVSMMIDGAMTQRAPEPPTSRQLWYCREHSITVPAGATKQSVGALIGGSMSGLKSP